MTHRRILSAPTKTRLVAALKACRDTCTDAMREMPITGDDGAVYRATQAFLEAIDTYAGALTGDMQALLDPPHQWPPRE